MSLGGSDSWLVDRVTGWPLRPFGNHYFPIKPTNVDLLLSGADQYVVM